MVERATDVADAGLSDQIAQLETEIEQLADTLERCRKAMLVSGVAIAGGAVLILAYVLGAVMFGPAIMVGAIAAVIGGVVVLGSNSGTAKQAGASLLEAETLRGMLIDRIDPRTVGRGTNNSFPE